MSKENLIKDMNKQLANWNVLNTKLHHYHWYVKGPDFFTLHEKFEEIYNEAAGYIDEIAERILTIGGEPVSTLRDYLNLSTLDEATGGESANDMVAALSQDFTNLTSELNTVIEVAEESNDHPTADLFIGIKASVEKHNWMLKAYLGK
ncbi:MULTISPECIES: Dps family protein [Bacillaceae]|uniref:DNA starvation/stationary phase protection protein n=1 Tax=Evansella alkalicola TaxID=745819 RepID=A0ABS6JZ24_9BACI|nr:MULTISPECIES: Dps family protein [Bacillaceae]MBU9723753.1 DNA starvation/stationary phase protection protein [Bacillus alkalicola]